MRKLHELQEDYRKQCEETEKKMRREFEEREKRDAEVMRRR